MSHLDMRHVKIVSLLAAACLNAGPLLAEPAAAGGENTVPATRPATTRPATAARQPATMKPAAKPATPTASPRTNARSPKAKELPPAVASVVTKAVEDMQKEVEAEDIRRTSSYFTDHPAKELTAEMVFGLLDRRMDQNATVDAYIKWQFLSALPRSLADEYRQQAIALLRSAPRPETLPGTIADDPQRRQLENQVRSLREDDAEAATKDLEAARDKVRRSNDPILLYRDALMGLCPESYEAVVAGFEDAYARAQAGESVSQAFDGAARNASRWLHGKPQHRQVLQLENLLAELNNAPLPETVSGFSWDRRQGMLRLQIRRGTMPSSPTMRTLSDDIRRALGGGDQDPVADETPKGRRRK